MRAVSFIFLCILATVTPLPVTVIFICAYALFWDGYELLFLAISLDTFFGAGAVMPYYTVGTMVLLVLVVRLKPRLLMYS